jgi:hypothetical protein
MATIRGAADDKLTAFHEVQRAIPAFAVSLIFAEV